MSNLAAANSTFFSALIYTNSAVGYVWGCWCTHALGLTEEGNPQKKRLVRWQQQSRHIPPKKSMLVLISCSIVQT